MCGGNEGEYKSALYNVLAPLLINNNRNAYSFVRAIVEEGMGNFV